MFNGEMVELVDIFQNYDYLYIKVSKIAIMKKKYSKENLENIVRNSYSIAEVLRKLGLSPVGGSYKTIHKYIELYNIDISHFTGQRWNKGAKNEDECAVVKLNEILKENISFKSSSLKERLIKEGLKEDRCERCGEKYNKFGEKLTLELHHINGNHYDNRLENLQILCTDCHSKTKGYCVPKNNKDTIMPYDEHRTKIYYCKNCGKEFFSNKKRTYCCIDCYYDDLKRRSEERKKELTIDMLQEIAKDCTSIKQLSIRLNISRTKTRNILKEYGLYDSFKEKYDFHSKIILQINIDGEIIKELPSIRDAQETLNIKSIDKCLCGKRRSAGGFIWRYKNIK